MSEKEIKEVAMSLIKKYPQEINPIGNEDAVDVAIRLLKNMVVIRLGANKEIK